jgi:alkylation response protein AidB-like acyl-CoA dehydrogenase
MTRFKENSMQTTQIPTRTELIDRASEIRPILQRHTLWQEQHRRLHNETIEALLQAGLFRLRLPTRYGGYESDTGTLVEVLTELGLCQSSASGAIFRRPTCKA